MTTKNKSDYLGNGQNLRNDQCGGNNSEVDVIQLDSSDENIENENDNHGKFWQLMRACAQRKVRVHSYSYRKQQYCAIGSVVLHRTAKTNLRKRLDDGDVHYYDVGSVIQLCSVIKTLTYGMYLKRLSRQKSKCVLAVAEPLFQQLRPYLLGETEIRPSAIDPNGPVPLLKEASLVNNKYLKEKASTPSTSVSTRALNEQVTIDGIEGEFFENPCYMEFLMNWLMHTNLECVKNTCVIKLTTEQQTELNTTDESCHHVFMTINHLPASHFFGSGFGLDQKKAFWAASRSIVRRLYHAGFITPLLYRTIGKFGRAEFSGKMKSWRRIKEWKIVRNAVEWFRNTMTARIPHWVQLTKNGLSTEEFVKMTDEVLATSRIIAEKHGVEWNRITTRKRKSNESMEYLIETKKNKNFSSRKVIFFIFEQNDEFSQLVEIDETKLEGKANFLNSLNVPSTSTALMPNSEMNLYNNSRTTAKDGVVSINDKFHICLTKTIKTGIASNQDANHGDCAAMEPVKAKSTVTCGNRSISNVHENLSCYEIADDEDVILEEEILPPVNIHAASVSTLPFNSSGSKYGALCSVLGVTCMEETLAIRSIIKEKRAMFAKEFKLFDEHIWRHFQINGQDDRTFSWKMTVRQKLLTLIRQVYKDSNLIAVGSTVNGCGSYNSDMDLCICQPYKNHSFEASRSYSIHVLRKLHKKFITNWRQMFKTCQYIPAKVPIIKLEMAAPYEELEIDINCNNVAGIYNSHLLHYYSRVDDRFPALCLLVKHWAINAGINNAMMGTLNSYSLILMVLHFLQCGTFPPVLPNLQFLYPSLFNATCSLDSLELFRDLPYPLPPRELNSETVGELLIAFFDYYARFDFKNRAISIRNGCVYGRDLLADSTMRFKIFIEEPYDQKNTARCVTSIENLQLIREAFTSARNAFLQTSAGPPVLEYIGVR
uniref:PAP-associated domain-containing protein n=1 Tax=Elaeophora elaphi TaxID=1147741 RepID=A0A0R3RVM5_9BILA